ncbi:pilus assembly protein PilP [Photobacterium sp. OFAV2-7]|uniref:pilus assembly protein PilP n=1 Tax=Photobacterium sp. OFAV2-7 TaxID=2917748 RepID=UPI001EF5DCB0|nr:pilus assembly protein PilP [Photobacterium sp. OFAV2-7]MCG7584666.1 pilus assembly protein PilP [Photobacterium sp. OFAV2-7]
MSLLVFMCWLVVGCRANEDSVQQFIEQAHNQALVQIAPLQEQYVFVADEFVMASNRIPFVRPRPELKTVGQERDMACWQPDMTRTRSALEGIPLAQLRMKGVIGDKHELWAIIARPDGKLEKVRDGHYLGLNFGKVRQVSPSSVEIEEVLPDGMGCWLKRLTTLPLASAGSAV